MVVVNEGRVRFLHKILLNEVWKIAVHLFWPQIGFRRLMQTVLKRDKDLRNNFRVVAEFLPVKLAFLRLSQ